MTVTISPRVLPLLPISAFLVSVIGNLIWYEYFFEVNIKQTKSFLSNIIIHINWFSYIWFIFTYSYVIGLYYGHYPGHPHWPFVSDVGAQPPESCLFGFFMAIFSLLAFISIMIYHEYLSDSGHGSKWNDCARVLSLLSYVGALIVATFQVKQSKRYSKRYIFIYAYATTANNDICTSGVRKGVGFDIRNILLVDFLNDQQR